MRDEKLTSMPAKAAKVAGEQGSRRLGYDDRRKRFLEATAAKEASRGDPTGDASEGFHFECGKELAWYDGVEEMIQGVFGPEDA